jgi:2-polyprenyl-3-methyl-5-hydroxy-6-metoxy-1,4-benzoquinol methylase
MGKVRDELRRRWLRVTLKRAEAADAHRRIDLAYTIRDPWGMATDREQHRFAECNRIVRENLMSPGQRVGRMLEIGCGEGHQSEHLVTLCDELVGLDVSAHAILRARQRVPRATFASGDLFHQPWSNDTDRFDIATAFEVLIMVKDIPATLERMDRLAPMAIVSWLNSDRDYVEPRVRAHGFDGTAAIRHDDTSWTVAWWRRKLGPLLVLLVAGVGRCCGVDVEELPLLIEYELALT